MKKSDVILLAGIIMALIWLGMCVVFEGKKRKYVIITGCIIDFVLFLICKNGGMLFCGILGGLLGGLFLGPGISLQKYNVAIKELNGIKNFVIAMIIFFTMMFMTIAIAHPELGKWF